MEKKKFVNVFVETPAGGNYVTIKAMKAYVTTNDAQANRENIVKTCCIKEGQKVLVKTPFAAGILIDNFTMKKGKIVDLDMSYLDQDYEGYAMEEM